MKAAINAHLVADSCNIIVMIQGVGEVRPGLVTDIGADAFGSGKPDAAASEYFTVVALWPTHSAKKIT